MLVRDRTTRLDETLERGDVDAPIPMGDGDERPGRPVARPIALVVDSAPASRLRTRNDLTAAGYLVNTCPGPDGGASCPGVRGGGPPCSRGTQGTALVVLAGEAASLADFYRRWLPTADVRSDRPLGLLPA